jgi:hypothetical protein
VEERLNDQMEWENSALINTPEFDPVGDRRMHQEQGWGAAIRNQIPAAGEWDLEISNKPSNTKGIDDGSIHHFLCK